MISYKNAIKSRSIINAVCKRIPSSKGSSRYILQKMDNNSNMIPSGYA